MTTTPQKHTTLKRAYDNWIIALVAARMHYSKTNADAEDKAYREMLNRLPYYTDGAEIGSHQAADILGVPRVNRYSELKEAR